MDSRAFKMYDNQVKFYKRKYKQFRLGLKEYSIKKGLIDSGYTYKDIKYLLEENIEELRRVIENILCNTDLGKVSNIFYMGVVCELLDKCNIWYTMHVGFVLPTKVKSEDYYKDLIICNYMYIRGENGIDYHYFNGDIHGENFTYIRDDIVEV